MLPAAEERTPALTSGEETFSLAAGVALAALDTHQGTHAAQGKKPHQGSFSKKRALRVSPMWAKWPGTHQDRKCSWSKTVVGSALDANGSTLTDASGRSYTWDFENRLAQVFNPGVGTTTFKYDPFGRRIQKSGPLGTTNYLYDAGSILSEVDSSGNVVARYVQGENVDEPFAELRSGATSYYHADGLGSITSLTNSSGTTAASYAYDAFGNLSASTGSLTNPFRYTAREFDSETGTYYYRARYYDSSVGRWQSEDPLRFFAGMNFYSYVSNNPTNYRDPWGLAGEESGCVYEIDCIHPPDERERILHEHDYLTPGPNIPGPGPTKPPSPPRPDTCDHANHDCTAAWVETGVGIAATLGNVALVWYLAPEFAEEGIVGGMDWAHVGPALAPGVMIYIHGVVDLTECK